MPITIREEAPASLRDAVPQIAYSLDIGPGVLRRITCNILCIPPDPGNWSEYPNVDLEVRDLIAHAEWYDVYDIIEAVAEYADNKADGSGAKWEEELNDHFAETGIGWQLVNSRIEIRGEEGFEAPVKAAVEALADAGRDTAAKELHEAIADLSRRPAADPTGAIQHAMASLECTARDVTGDKKGTLGEIIARNPGLIPKPLDQAIEKAWGYASERARHIREGEVPTLQDAQLIVGLAAAVSTYLSPRKANS